METVIKSKMNKVLNRMEDPRETLDYSYEKQLELLQNVKRGVAEVTTSKKRLQLQRVKLTQNIDKLGGQAKGAVAANREDLARLALERKAALVQQVEGIDREIEELEKQEEKLIAAKERLSTKVEIFRTRKESIKAQYSAAEAQVKVNESVTGISEEMADIGLAIERAEDKTEEMKARADAIDELMEAGTLQDLTSGRDDVDRELSKIGVKSSVESELARLKAETGKRPEKAKIGEESKSAEEKGDSWVIIRIMGEGQYQASNALRSELNKIDDRIVTLVEEGNAVEFRRELKRLISMIKEKAMPIDAKEIVNSDIIVPPADMSFDEAKAVFKKPGIIED
ncbi:MAG: phage shock protein [Euryarchaeota archaeon]|nr:phage shock protein [Euryarchaeota archaeon]